MSELIKVQFDDLFLRMEDGDGKTLTGHAVPWDRPTYVRSPIEGFEVFKRGALTRSWKESKKPIPLLGLHMESEPIGKVVRSEDDEKGQFVEFRLFDSQAAKDAAELVREGVWTGLSVGAYGVPARTKVVTQVDGTRRIERSEVIWDHVGLVRTPAYEDAKVLALRSQESATDLAAVVAARKRQLELMLSRNR